MILVLFAVLAAAIGTRAEISYQGGIVVKGPLSSCSCSENFIPGPLYNELAAPYSGKYPGGIQTFSNVPTQNVVQVNNPCTCGCSRAPTNPVPLVGRPGPPFGPRVIPVAPRFPEVVSPPVFRTLTDLSTNPPTIVEPPVPKAPDPPTINEEPRTSPIMKIPKKTSITLNPPDSSYQYGYPSNSIFSSLPPPPPRPLFYTQPPPFVASCPATIPLFYPTTIPAFPMYPPFTCPAHPPYPTYPTLPSQADRPTQPFPPPTSSVPLSTKLGEAVKTIASFTSTIPETKFYNVTTNGEKRDPLLTFKLLTAAASKPPETATTPSPDPGAVAASQDCSMPIPPVVV